MELSAEDKKMIEEMSEYTRRQYRQDEEREDKFLEEWHKELEEKKKNNSN